MWYTTMKQLPLNSINQEFRQIDFNQKFSYISNVGKFSGSNYLLYNYSSVESIKTPVIQLYQYFNHETNKQRITPSNYSIITFEIWSLLSYILELRKRVKHLLKNHQTYSQLFGNFWAVMSVNDYIREKFCPGKGCPS